MKDFRNYKPGSNSTPNVPGKNSPIPSSGGSFRYLLVSIILIGSFYLFSIQKENLEGEGSSGFFSQIRELGLEVLDTIQIFRNAIVEEWNAENSEASDGNIQENQNSTDESDSNSIESVANLLSISEYYVNTTGEDSEVLGIIKNNSEVIIGRVKIHVDLSNPGRRETGYISSAFLHPGESMPFSVTLKNFTGDSDLDLSIEPVKHYIQNLPRVKYKVSEGKWENTGFVLKYTADFELLSQDPIRFSQVIYAFRDKSGKIYKVHGYYIVTKEEDYNMAGGSKKRFTMPIFGTKEIPHKMDAFFSYLPRSN